MNKKYNPPQPTMKMIKIFTAITFTCLLHLNGMAQTWNLQNQFQNIEPGDMHFIDDNTGFIIADSTQNGTFITTVCITTQNGGQSWSHFPLNNANGNTFKCYFLNANEGFIAGRGAGGNSGMFMKTTNGGSTWSAPVLFNERVNNVFFLNASTGWVMGKNGLLQKTVDGGVTWSPQSLTNEDGFSMRFYNLTTGLFACGGGELYLTTDGGMSWQSVTSGTGDNLMSISISGNDAWVCGEGGAVVYSNTAGQTWVAQTSNTAVDFNDVAFVSATEGWLVGLSGEMKYTSDGGTTWVSQTSSSGADIMAIEMRNSGLGWFLDTDGDLYKYSSPAGIEDIKNAVPVNVYPNPIEDEIHILKSDVNWSKAVLMDATGKVLYTAVLQRKADHHSVNISHLQLSPGIYLLRLENDDRTGVQKLIKK
jgi:photosystem II stability/assembly factor-like uncharacterized protein